MEETSSPSSISAAAHAYQLAMSQVTGTGHMDVASITTPPQTTKDAVMQDSTIEVFQYI